MINFKAIGQRIKDERKQHGLTQEKLAEALDISIEHLSHIETGNRRPSLILIEKLSEILEINEETLMFGSAGDKNTNKLITERFEALTDKKKQAVISIIDLISD